MTKIWPKPLELPNLAKPFQMRDNLANPQIIQQQRKGSQNQATKHRTKPKLEMGRTKLDPQLGRFGPTKPNTPLW